MYYYFYYVALHVQLLFLLMRAEKPYYHAIMGDKKNETEQENVHVKN